MHTVDEHALDYMRRSFKKDFAVINPTCLEDCGKAYIDNILEYGYDHWYEWACNNWGTKWNACNTRIGVNEVSFDTAWCEPIPVIRALSEKFPNLVVRINGKRFKNGEEI